MTELFKFIRIRSSNYTYEKDFITRDKIYFDNFYVSRFNLITFDYRNMLLLKKIKLKLIIALHALQHFMGAKGSLKKPHFHLKSSFQLGKAPLLISCTDSSMKPHKMHFILKKKNTIYHGSTWLFRVNIVKTYPV